MDLAALYDKQFFCTVCKEVFTDPVTTPCGHNFCKACLTRFWDSCDVCQCPSCENKFDRPQNPMVNTVLSQISQHFKSKGLKTPKAEVELEGDNGFLSGQASRCDEAAQSCSTGDLLVDPALDLKDRKCEKHDQPLEIFCSTDHTCICTECVGDGHGDHSTTPVEREWLCRHTELRKNVMQVKQQILDRQRKMEEIKRQTRLSREDGERELRQILEALMRFVEKCQGEIMEVIEEKQKEMESRAQNLLEELVEEIRELKTTKAKLKELLSCQDHIKVLHSLPSTPCPQNWDKSTASIELCVRTVENRLPPSEANFRKNLRELIDAQFKKIRQGADFRMIHLYADEVTLDPVTAHCNLVVSRNGKEVHYQNEIQDVPDNPERFDPVRNVLGKQTFKSGRHYWEVQVEGKTSWYLGVVMASIHRKGSITPAPKNGLWLLHLEEGKSLRALNASPVELSLNENLKTVGVYVDYEEGDISFYNVETRSHLFSFSGCAFTEELCLLLNPRGNDSIPMILSPVPQNLS